MRITLDHEYCLKCDTEILGVAGEKNARKMIFNGIETEGASRYEIKFGLPDGSFVTKTIVSGTYTIASDVVERAGYVLVQVQAVSGSTLVRKSNILRMRVLDSIDYEPPDPPEKPLPQMRGLDGIFEYGNIDGLTWKNSVSDENDIIFTNITDTGAEYTLSKTNSGGYTSKSGEYRTEFTWYCIAKCPITSYNEGQFMISNWGDGAGIEISSGWIAFNPAGTNHLVRSINHDDFNSRMAITDYALIAVAGDENGVASIYVNGVKMTDSWNFSPVPIGWTNMVFLGGRANGQSSGTEIYYKFLAFGTVRQNDEEILENSEYLMEKYSITETEG